MNDDSPTDPLASWFGKWPGNETDEQIFAALKEDSASKPSDLVSRLLVLHWETYRDTGMKIDIEVTLPNALYLDIVKRMAPVTHGIAPVDELRIGTGIVLRPARPL